MARRAAGTPADRGAATLLRVRRVLEWRWTIWIFTAVMFAWYAVFSIRRHLNIRTAGFDLGIFHQVVSAYSRFQAPIVTLKGPNYNILGDHFHPILALIAPLYWIWHSPIVLLLVQAALIAISIPIVYSYTKRHWGKDLAALLALGYGLGWPLQRIIEFDFHEVSFAVPLIALALDALDRRNDRRLLVACLFLLFVREDMGLLVLLIGCYRLFRRPRWVAGLLIIAGPLFVYLTTRVILPAFNPNKTFAYWEYTSLGPDAPSAIVRMITHPWIPLALWVTPPIKLVTQLLLFGPLLFVCLRSRYVLLALPLLAQRFFSDRRLLWYPGFHYNAPIWVILVLAAVDGTERLRSRARTRALGTRMRRPVALACALVMVIGTCAADSNPFPLNKVFHPSFWTYGSHELDVTWVLSQVKPGTCYAGDDRMIPPMLATNAVRQVHPEDRWADYIALDFAEADPGYKLPSTALTYQIALENGYEPMARAGTVILLRRDTYNGPTPRCRP